MDNIKLKIQKLLALSKSSNENEAQNAIMMAQKLLLKHKLSLKEVEDYSKTNIDLDSYKTSHKFKGSSWKSNLGSVIANNFGCYMYLETSNSHKVCFYGKSEDVAICNIMLDYAIKCINLNGDKLVKKMKNDKRRKYFKGIKSDYALGFIRGLEERFKAQVSSNKEWGLLLQKEEAVILGYKEFSSGFNSIDVNQEFYKYNSAFELGKKDGSLFDISDKIENEGSEELQISNY